MILRKIKKFLTSMFVINSEGEFTLIQDCNTWNCLTEVDKDGDICLSTEDNEDLFLEKDSDNNIQFKGV